jgi:hypothetical protein
MQPRCQEKRNPHRPYADGGTKARKSMKELFAQPKDLSRKPDAKEKKPHRQ